ncbi:tyrosine-protein phosphatase [Candidatus Leptofilum sp.]|uniref:tyrosine-protein phosphatase n=1 Tax=Candidatus Leptofilum sp. TaxID=3241576 RepID=UPI003B5BE259
MPLLNLFTASAKNRLKDPTAFILPLTEPVTVTRTEDDFLQVAWQELADRTIIYVGTNPDDLHGMVQILSVCKAREAMVAGLNTAVRHYFRLEFQGGAWDGRSLLAAERILPLQKGVNFRDAGGFYTKEGQMVRWGKLYRSGSLTRLTPSDLAYLQRLGIRLVSDFRSPEEREKHPDRLPEMPGLVERPLPMESVDRWERLRGAYAIFFRKGKLDDYLLDGYTRVVLDSNAHRIGEIFQRLADPAQLPAVLHCTAGKDRTGLVVALLLLSLGVPEETVLADYTMSNHFYAHFRKGIAAELKQVAPWGVNIDDLQDLLLVKAKTLQGALAHMRQKYGSLEGYLRNQAGVSDETIARLRQTWLVDVNELDF